MNAPAERRLRADAARNAERIITAARQAFIEQGTDVSLEEIARRSSVGVATVYRRFANKEELIRAVLQQRYAEQVQPAIEGARTDPDPWRAMVTALDAALTMAAQDKAVVMAARELSTVTDHLISQYFTELTEIMLRAQNAGLVRPDLSPHDLPRLVIMLMGPMRMSERPNDDWRRYFALLLDALRPVAAHPLPPASALEQPFPRKYQDHHRHHD